jgi:tetratricopeptide (TPR) repeat protein
MQMRRLLADILIRQGKFADAEAQLREWLDYQRRTMGEKDPQIADTFRTLAELYRLTGRGAEAAAALDRAERIYGPAQTARLIDAATVRGHLALLAGDATAAQAAYDKARADAVAFYGPRHRAVAAALVGSGVAQAKQGRVDAGVAAIREAIAILEAQPLPLPAPMATAYGALADVLIDAGQVSPEAREAATKALDFSRRLGAPAHPDTVKAEERVRRLQGAGA